MRSTGIPAAVIRFFILFPAGIVVFQGKEFYDSVKDLEVLHVMPHGHRFLRGLRMGSNMVGTLDTVLHFFRPISYCVVVSLISFSWAVARRILFQLFLIAPERFRKRIGASLSGSRRCRDHHPSYMCDRLAICVPTSH